MSGPSREFPVSPLVPIAERYFLACSGEVGQASDGVAALMARLARYGPALDAGLLPLAWVREMSRLGRQLARQAEPLEPDARLDLEATWQRALRVLPAAERDALFAVDLYRLPVNDAARALGALPRAVAARAAQARAHLLVLMRQQGHDIDDPVALITTGITRLHAVPAPAPAGAAPILTPSATWRCWRLRHALLLRRVAWGLGVTLLLVCVAVGVQMRFGNRQDAARDLRLLANELPPAAFVPDGEGR